MKNLFETDVYNESVKRINDLTPESKSRWGKMNVGQVLAHCKAAFMVPLSEKRLPRLFIGRIFGPFIKAKLYNESPWKKSLPTAPSLKIIDERDFNIEKNELLELVDKFYAAGPTGISKYPHPVFGKFTPEQWGKSMYKHLDHHLQQFGV
ncbi:MAG: DUF1569 domain-containing protein [Ferruginibacter sp.]